MKTHVDRNQPFARSSRAFTLIEVIVAACVAIGVLGTAYALMTSTSSTGIKTNDLASAVQGGATVLHALEMDLANIKVGTTAAGSVTVDLDTPLTRVLRFSRLSGRLRVGFDSADDVVESPVIYQATRTAVTEPFRFERRVQNSSNPAEDDLVRFSGVFARDARFTLAKEGPTQFLRVSLLLQGSDAADALRDAANRARPYIVTALFYVPIKGP